MFKKRVFFAKIIKNQKKIASIFFYIQKIRYLCTTLLDNRLSIYLKDYPIMKKKYTQPDILCEKLASSNVIMTSMPGATDEPADPDVPGLAPKRQGIWEDEE